MMENYDSRTLSLDSAECTKFKVTAESVGLTIGWDSAEKPALPAKLRLAASELAARHRRRFPRSITKLTGCTLGADLNYVHGAPCTGKSSIW